MADWDLEIAKAAIKINANTKNADGYLQRGIARCCKGGEKSDYEKAIEDFSLAEALGNNSDEKVFYYRALAYYMVDDYANALKVCKKHIKTQPARGELLGDINLKLKQYKNAVTHYEAALNNYFQNPKLTHLPLSNRIPSAALLQNYKKAKDRLKEES